MALLEVNDLTVSFHTIDGIVQAVRGVSFSVDRARTLGIVGESGSGKTVSTLSLIGLVPGARVSGQALFEGRDLLTMPPDEMRSVRGAKVAAIFQDPLSSLHPLYRVGWQVVEMIRAHENTSKAKARRRALDLLRLVGIPNAERRLDDYPHEFSGGMRQRAMIAMALALNPALIIADEPTTALDATVQAQIIDLLTRLQREFDSALIMITHDLGVIADVADDVMVMYAGRGAEQADLRTIYYQPHHPYTRGLLESIPGATGAGERLRPIPGQPPSLLNPPSGCAFHPRCRYVMDRCITDAPTLDLEVGPGHRSACWLPADSRGMSEEAARIRDDAVLEGRSAPAEAIAARLAASTEMPTPAAVGTGEADARDGSVGVREDRR
ncbi:MAG: ABC transporter ATP-binding protein [Mycobacteriales bacterium]